MRSIDVNHSPDYSAQYPVALNMSDCKAVRNFAEIPQVEDAAEYAVFLATRKYVEQKSPRPSHMIRCKNTRGL